ncbi:MAG TPA: DNA methylase [Prolixibacteraceae bacterium]|nr:DNA methylase [Prolixibacteraceae bacterium]
MLEGLEVGVVKSTEVLEGNYRLEAKFYTSKSGLTNQYFLGEEILESANYNSIYGLNSNGIGCPVLRMNEFDMLFTGTPKQHSDKFSPVDIRQHSLKKDDILICRTNGNPNLIGKSALVAKNYDFVYESHLFKIRPKQVLINSSTLVTYLNTQYGRAEINKLSMQGNQANFSIAKFKELRIPKFEIGFCNKVKDIIEACFLSLEKSKILYTQAETLLLETLGLNNFEPSAEPVNVKSFKDSFLATGRLDAEYYQKKYEEVINHIIEQSHDRLSNLVSIKKSIEPGSDVYSNEGLPFLRVSDFNKFGLTEPDKKLSTSFCKENEALIKKLKPKKETIVFSKDGSVGTAYMLRKDEDLITSGAILHLMVKDKKRIIPEYLTLALNSKLVQMQAERDAGGSIILHWRVGEIENVIVPIIDYIKQEEIAALVEESFFLKKQSEQLLETAKRAVELAIEQDEKAAMRYIAEAQRASI